jgi:hypothetical protein
MKHSSLILSDSTSPAADHRLGYSIPEAVTISGIGRTLLYAEIAADRLLAVKAGHRTLIPRSALERFISGLPSATANAFARRKRRSTGRMANGIDPPILINRPAATSKFQRGRQRPAPADRAQEATGLLDDCPRCRPVHDLPSGAMRTCPPIRRQFSPVRGQSETASRRSHDHNFPSPTHVPLTRGHGVYRKAAGR